VQGVRVIGDAPIFVAYDSADVWCNRHLFQLDADGRPTAVAGVPPDYFSITGQLWGNPLYDWQRLAADGFGWWVARLRNDLTLYDIVRIDHFRGFAACWAVPAGQKTAVKGSWQPGPGDGLFESCRQALGQLPIIAEDLGVITPDVEALRDRFQFPGMKILQFAFGSGPANPYLPHNYQPGCVAYTGTHDNDTTAGWFASLDDRHRQRVLAYLRCSEREVVWELIRAVFASVAAMAIVPLQDVLELGAADRMNVPGVAGGNWGWRCTAGGYTVAHASRLRELAEMYNRNGQ
jgi:4-alpha-glucanotransferase